MRVTPETYTLGMDALEIIRQMQQDPALKAEMRAVLLGEEFLTLPELVQENSRQIAENSRQIAALSIGMDQLTARMDQLAERMDQVAARMDQLADIIRLHDARLIRVEDNLGQLQGDITEDKYRRSFASRAAKIEGRMRVSKVLSPGELADLSFTAADSGLVSDDEADQLLLADAVAFGTVRATGEEVILVAEVANRVHVDDVVRAIERAKIAGRAVPNRRAIPVVMGPKAEVIRDKAYSGVWLVENHEARELVGGIS